MPCINLRTKYLRNQGHQNWIRCCTKTPLSAPNIFFFPVFAAKAGLRMAHNLFLDLGIALVLQARKRINWDIYIANCYDKKNH